jgi:G3E family GTPase
MLRSSKRLKRLPDTVQRFHLHRLNQKHHFAGLHQPRQHDQVRFFFSHFKTKPETKSDDGAVVVRLGPSDDEYLRQELRTMIKNLSRNIARLKGELWEDQSQMTILEQSLNHSISQLTEIERMAQQGS